MKRSRELAQLSRDHHVALEAALRLRRADSETAAEAVARFRDFWDERGRRHFELEEELLLPAVDPGDAEWADGAARVRREHDDVRARAARIGDADAAELRELGDLLNAHVRYEERELFPMLEQRLSPDELAALGDALHRA